MINDQAKVTCFQEQKDGLNWKWKGMIKQRGKRREGSVKREGRGKWLEIIEQGLVSTRMTKDTLMQAVILLPSKPQKATYPVKHFFL